jgi:poly-gamma-glutamate synthesis protein (capsule biosynthesis protein)
MYLVTLWGNRKYLARIEMIPFQIRKFRLQRANSTDAGWLRDCLDRQCGLFGSTIEIGEDHVLELMPHRG